MVVTLYIPNETPHILSPNNFLLHSTVGHAQLLDLVADKLGCIPSLVDVLDTGPNYAAYSVFDCEGELNQSAIQMLMTISNYPYDPEDEDYQLRGPILIISQEEGINLRND